MMRKLLSVLACIGVMLMSQNAYALLLPYFTSML